jgi:serine/threonine protein kinase
LGRYELTRVLGKGAMGVVYEGRDPNLDRRVAIKTVRIENLSAEEVVEYDARFRTEARSAARLQHPNIVSVYDSDRDGDVAFLVMEFIEGEDLKHHLDQGLRYSLAESLRIIRDLLSALDYSHSQGIVHRDIKPANLLIEPGGRVKLTDFGVARMQDSSEATRTQGGMVGTLKYMSPEQVQGHKVDQRSDLFSAGVLLYQLLTNVRPFDGDTEYAIIHRIMEEELTPPSTLNAALPFAVDAVVARALAKDRERRYQSAQEFSVALQAAVQSSYDTTAVPPLSARRQRSESGLGTGTRGSLTDAATNSSGSTVTQELELVYWKDVRESDDPHELETFLRKFPIGVYADLARRRLRRLREASDASVPGLAVPAAREAGPWTQTQAYSRTQVEGAAEAEASPPAPTPPGPTPGPGLPGEDVTYFGTGGSGGAPPPEDPSAPSAGDGAGVPKAPTSRKPPVRTGALIAGVLVAVLAGAAVFMGGWRNTTDPAALAQPVAPVAAASAVSALPVASSAVATGGPRVNASGVVASPQGAASVASVAAVASAARVASSGVAAGRRHGASSPALVASASAPVPGASAPALRPAARPAAPASPPTPSVSAATNPEEACKGRMLLGLETCLKEQCNLAANRDHPVCKQRREWESWRQEGERARGSQGG